MSLLSNMDNIQTEVYFTPAIIGFFKENVAKIGILSHFLERNGAGKDHHS